MKIGLLSDTHSHLDENIFFHFKECDEIWHAGDIGDIALIEKLEQFKPLRAVHGNIDPPELRYRYPEDLRFSCGSLNVLMTHIGGSPPHYNPRAKSLLKEHTPHLFICGHTHILKIMKDPAFQGMLFINPGAAGNHGFHTMKTLVRFDVQGQRVENLQVIEMGKRGKLQ